MVFVSILVKKSDVLNLFIYLFEKNLVFYVEINESNMHEHGCSACGRRNLCVILSL